MHRFTFIQVAKFKFPAKVRALLLALKDILNSVMLR